MCRHDEMLMERRQAPLSFMTSLFAIPVKEFPHDDASQDLSYETPWLVGRMCKSLPSFLPRYPSSQAPLLAGT